MRAAVYVQTYPGIGLGVVSEWVSHNRHSLQGCLETTVALPFITLNAQVTIGPPRRR